MRIAIRRIVAALIAVMLMLAGSLCALAADPDSARGEYAEIIVESFFSGNADAAYEITFGMSRPEFESVYNEALGYIDGASEYRLIYADTFETVVSGALTEAVIYVLDTDIGAFEVDIALDGMYNKVGLISVYTAGDGWLDALEFGKYTVLSNESADVDDAESSRRMGLHYKPIGFYSAESTGLSRTLRIYSIAILIFVIVMVIDCLRRPIRHKWIWALLCVFASGYIIRVFVPVGAILYLCLRKKLMAESGADTENKGE